MLTTITSMLIRIVEVGANLVTLILGLMACYGLYKLRNRIGPLITNIRLNHVGDRSSEIKETLNQIEQLEFSGATSHQLRGLFGKLNGQLITLMSIAPELAEIQQQINGMLHERGRLNEAIKQQLVYHVRGQLQNAKLKGLETVTKEAR